VYPPSAFTGHGVAMLSTVLKSKRAAAVSVAIHARVCAIAADSLSLHRS